jgi:hypothetical protein
MIRSTSVAAKLKKKEGKKKKDQKKKKSNPSHVCVSVAAEARGCHDRIL